MKLPIIMRCFAMVAQLGTDFSEMKEKEIVRLMVGRSVDKAFPKQDVGLGDTVLSVANYSHPTEFRDISFDLRRGEILGIYGLVGAGRSEFAQSLFGMTTPSEGRVTLEGKEIKIRRSGEAIAHGIVYVPEERGRHGAVLQMPIFQNVSLPSLGRTSRNGFLRMAEEFKLARKYAERFDLRAAALSVPVGTLSGGNQQRSLLVNGLRPILRSSFSMSRPKASISALKPPFMNLSVNLLPKV